MRPIVIRIFAGALAMASFCAAAQLDPETRELARDVFRQLIEINTTDSSGSTTRAEAMRNRFSAAGFSAGDAQVLVPEGRPNKGNLVVRLRAQAAVKKPLLIIAHLDVVEARRSDWTTDPFQLVEKDGFFYGRGTQDMKAADAIAVTTLLPFRRDTRPRGISSSRSRPMRKADRGWRRLAPEESPRSAGFGIRAQSRLGWHDVRARKTGIHDY